MRPVCFFHAGCPDGFGAAWAVWRAWGRRGRYLPRGHDDHLDARLANQAAIQKSFCRADVVVDTDRPKPVVLSEVERLIGFLLDETSQ